MKIDRWHAATLQGPRARQEDRVLCLPALGLFAVADGMGGHPRGDEAAEAALDLLASTLRAAKGPPGLDVLRSGFEAADTAVAALAPARCPVTGTTEHKMSCGCARKRPGTTLTALWFAGPDQVLLGHVGDSRAYCARRRQGLRQVNTDHTLWGSMLSQFVGGMEEPELRRLCTQSGDVWVLATDGLKLEPDLIGEVLRSHAEDPAQVLCERALSAGGRDNVSVVVVRV